MVWLLLGNRLLNLAGAAVPERWSDASFLVLSSIVIHLVLRRFATLIVDEYAQLAQSEALLQAKFMALPSPCLHLRPGYDAHPRRESGGTGILRMGT